MGRMSSMRTSGRLRTRRIPGLLEEARLTRACGAGITGGDPLMDLDRCVDYITLLKKEFGKRFHIHLYTPLKLVSMSRLWLASIRQALDEDQVPILIWMMIRYGLVCRWAASSSGRSVSRYRSFLVMKQRQRSSSILWQARSTSSISTSLRYQTPRRLITAWID